MLSAEIFARHLDLTPLKGRRRGKVRCIFHAERTASLSVDLDAAVFHCFGCGAQGGVVKFAQLVGEASPSPAADTTEPSVGTRGMQLARTQPWHHETTWRTYEIADWIRNTRREVAHVRAIATEADWDVLARCAQLEAVANWAESELDA